MLPRPALGATNAQRKGGLRTRSHNDDRTKGTVTGLPIPEAPRGSDGIENFEDLLEQGYDQNKQAEPRSMRPRTTNGLSKAASAFTGQAIGDQIDRMLEKRSLSNTEAHSRGGSESSTIPSIAPPTSRLLRTADMDYTQIPTPRANHSRLGFTPSLSTGAFRPRSPAYDPTGSLPYAVPRASQGFGALSRYQDEPPDFNPMEQYVDYDAGLENDKSLSPLEKVSPPPQLARKVVHSPVVSRTPRPGAKDATTPRRSPVPLSDRRSEDEGQQATSRHQALTKEATTTGAEEAREKFTSPPSSSRKVKGKQRSVAPVDEDEDEDDLNISNEVAPSRKSNGLAIRVDEPEENGVHHSPPISKDKPKSSQKSASKGKVAELIDEDYDRADEPEENGHIYGDEDAGQHDDYDQEQVGLEASPQDEPPLTGTERHSDQRSGLEEPAPKAKKSQKKDKESQKKKRAREDDEEPVRQKKKPKSTSAKPPSQVRSKTPVEDQSYFEELEEPPSEEEEEAVGTRRSHRAKLAPLKFWLGEKLEYDTWKPGKSTVVPTILGVRRVPEHHESLQRKKRRSRQQSRSKSRRLQTEEPESDAEVVIYKDWDIDTDPKVNVVDYETGEMVEKLVAFTKAMVVPKFTAKAHFKYQRIFSDERFFAAGQLVIPKGGEKPKKSSKDNTYAFYVIEGAIRVTINETAFNLNPGGMFMVPRGNYYHIRSAGVTDAKLFFVQGRLMTQDDMETASYGDPARAESALPSSRAYGGEDLGSSRHRVSSSPQRRGARLSSSPSKSRRR